MQGLRKEADMTDRYPIPDFLRRQPEQAAGPRERPILFSPEMVRAILAGTKTQTRRVCKPAELAGLSFVVGPFDCPELGRGFFGDEEGDVQFQCPYGRQSDRLWVREAWAQPTTLDPGPTFYRADYPACVPPHFENVPPVDQVKWKPSIHLRRDQSRILLEIIAVRVERLQDISETDAIAEGVNVHPDHHEKPRGSIYSPVQAYRDLWEFINGPDAWAVNPWVWVVEFRRIVP